MRTGDHGCMTVVVVKEPDTDRTLTLTPTDQQSVGCNDESIMIFRKCIAALLETP